MRFTPFFVHIYLHNSKKMNSRTRGITLYVRPFNDLYCAVHAARCNPKDQYNKKLGAQQAMDQPNCGLFKFLEVPKLCADIAKDILPWVTPEHYDYLLKRFFH